MSLRDFIFSPSVRPHVARLVKCVPLQLAYYLGGRGLRPISAFSYFEVPERIPQYLAAIGKKGGPIAELLCIDNDIRTGSLDSRNICDRLSRSTLAYLFSCRVKKLSEISKSLNRVGFFQLAGFVRAIALLRAASANISEGLNKTGEIMVLEISYNDFCDQILLNNCHANKIDQTRLLEAVEQMRSRSLEEKISLFTDLNDQDKAKVSIMDQFQGSTIVLQGPSKRETELEHSANDLIAVVGNVDSLPEPVEKAHLAFMVPHKIASIRIKDAGCQLSDLTCTIFSKHWAYKEKQGSAEFIKKQKRSELDLDYASQFCHSMISNIHSAYLYSAFNAGTECFLFLLTLRPATVKVRQVDLFVNPFYRGGHNALGRGDEKSDDVWRYDKSEVLRFFGYHEPSQQFSAYKAFINHPEVQYDRFLANIMSGSLSDYLAQLEEAYRPGRILK